MTDRTAMTAPTDFTVLAASTAESSKVIGSVTPTGDAVRTLGLLAGGVGADRRADQHGAGVNADGAAVDGDREAVENTGGGATLLLAEPVILRAVALELEPLRGDALGHAATEVDALQVERPLTGHHAGTPRGGT